MILVIFHPGVTSRTTQLLSCDLNSLPLFLKTVYGIILKVPFFKLLVGMSFLFVFLSLSLLTFTNVQETNRNTSRKNTLLNCTGLFTDSVNLQYASITDNNNNNNNNNFI